MSDQLTWSLLLPIAVVAVTALSLGYDEGVMSGAGAPMAKYFKLGEWETGMMMGCVNIVAAPGAILASWVADYLGRVRSTALTAFVLVVGAVLVSISDSFALVMVGRTLIGLGVGFAFVIPPVYAAELAPPETRGRLVTIVEILINLGIVFGYMSAFLLNNPRFAVETGWRLVYGIAATPPLLVLLFTPLLPESPRWLAKEGRWSEAESVLQRVCSDEEGARNAKNAIQQALQEEQIEHGWSHLLCPSPTVRRMLFAGVGIAFFQQACGSESMVYYSPLILDRFGIDKGVNTSRDTMMVGIAKLIGAIIGGPFLDLVGRRPGVLISCAGCGTSLVAMAILVGTKVPFFGLVLICLFMVTFELGLAPAAFVVGTESYPVTIRAKALSMGMFTTRLISGLVSACFPAMVQAFTMQGTLGIYGVLSFVGFGWMLLFVPETKGLPLEEVAQLFAEPLALPLVSGKTAEPEEYGSTTKSL